MFGMLGLDEVAKREAKAATLEGTEVMRENMVVAGRSYLAAYNGVIRVRQRHTCEVIPAMVLPD